MTFAFFSLNPLEILLLVVVVGGGGVFVFLLLFFVRTFSGRSGSMSPRDDLERLREDNERAHDRIERLEEENRRLRQLPPVPAERRITPSE